MASLLGNAKRVIVVGGGVVGTATLYELARRNIDVILVEAGPQLAGETSFANGGMMTPSQAEPWNSPGVAGHLFASLFDPQAALKLRVKALPGLLSWGLQFLRNSTAKRYHQAAISNYLLAAYSAQYTAQITDLHTLGFTQKSGGTLKIFTEVSQLNKSVKVADFFRKKGLSYEMLTAKKAMQLEPALAGCKSKLAGAIHYPDDSVADVRDFTLALGKAAQDLGAVIRPNTRVTALQQENGRIVGVKTTAGTISGTVVLAAGCATAYLGKSVGLHLPIQPAKGYSLSINAAGLHSLCPKIPVVDEAMHTAISPIGPILRVVGTAEFAGNDLELRPERIQNLIQVCTRLFPELSTKIDWQQATPWAGLRPMSSDGVPFIGAGSMPGLWVNSGQGHLGWTMAMGSAGLLADQMLGETPQIDPSPYQCRR